jgi:hypothetical protein
LVQNDELGVLKVKEIDGLTNVDYMLMHLKYKVADYKKDIQDAMAHKF